MSAKQAKALRGQLRQIVQEILPEILASELAINTLKQIQAEVSKRLDAIDQRQKDIQGYMVRNSSGISIQNK